MSEDEIDCGHHSWSGLMRLLDEHWPDDIFPTRYDDDPARDAGPRIVSLIRVVDSLRADAERVRELEATVRNAVTWMETGFPERAKANLRRVLDGDR